MSKSTAPRSRRPAQPHSDIKSDHWLLSLASPALRPYFLLLRFDRLIGLWLLLLPCFWGLGLFADHYLPAEFVYYLLLFSLGAVAMRSAGCVWNDILDREIDRKVSRTKGRPLASGAIGLHEAVLVMLGLLFVGLVVVTMLGVREAQVVAFLSLGLVAPYPLMKRFFPLPQLWLGFTFNVGILVAGMLVVRDFFNPGLWLLYAVGICWTMAYDTIYALQDIEEDEMLGLQSAPLFFGKRVKQAVGFFYGLMAVLLLYLFYYMGGSFDLGSITSLLLLTAAFALMIYCYRKLDVKDPKICLKIFRWQLWVGVLIFLALCVRPW